MIHLTTSLSFSTEKSTQRALCTRLKMQEKNTHVQLINKSEKHISSKKY